MRYGAVPKVGAAVAIRVMFPLLETFEERYASAPINARKVFEAELATYGSRHFAHWYFIARMQTLYLFGEHEAALACFDEAYRLADEEREARISG